MFGLAGVMYAGTTPTAAEKAYTPAQVGEFFAADRATDDYAYSDPAEDLAMTQEELLMSRRLGVRRDVAYSDNGNALYPVRWGQRGRVGDSAIRVRARSVLDVSAKRSEARALSEQTVQMHSWSAVARSSPTEEIAPLPVKACAGADSTTCTRKPGPDAGQKI